MSETADPTKTFLNAHIHFVDGYKHMEFVPASVLERIKTFKFYPEDVLVVGHPRTGSNWTAELTWQILFGNDVGSSTKKLLEKAPFLEIHPPADEKPVLDTLIGMKPPRVIKTHLLPCYLEDHMKKTSFKLISIMRNPKDMLVSYYHFINGMYKITLSWDGFFDCFMRDEMLFVDYFVHVRKWWEMRSNSNILYLHYEEIKEDTPATIRKIAEHVGKQLTEQQVQDIVAATSIEHMMENTEEVVKSFLIRKGEVGGWRKYFSKEQEEKIDAKTRDLEETHGLSFTT